MVMLGYRSTLARYSMVFVELQYLGTYLQETERPAVVQGKVFVVSHGLAEVLVERHGFSLEEARDKLCIRSWIWVDLVQGVRDCAV